MTLYPETVDFVKETRNPNPVISFRYVEEDGRQSTMMIQRFMHRVQEVKETKMRGLAFPET